MNNISQEEYKQRRAKFIAQLPTDSIAILPASPVQHKSADSYFHYHPNTNLYYLTGYIEPECVAVFIPKRAEGEFILFNLPKNRQEEIWHGYRVGQEDAVKKFGADQAFLINEFEEKMFELMQGRSQLYYSLGRNLAFDQTVVNVLNQLRAKVRSGVKVPESIVNLETIVHEMRLIKSPAEIEMLRKAGQASVEAHKRAMKAAKPGLNEYHIAAELMYGFMNAGCSGNAYDNIVAAGANGIVLHYTSNDMPLQDGDLLLVDAGGEYQYYDADITVTYPINGKFTPEQKIIYDLVLKAQHEALKVIKPGTLWWHIQETITRVFTEGLFALGILKGDVNTLLKEREYFKVYMHNSGHWLGLDTHDVGDYKVNGEWRPLQPGMVLTVEPGLYLAKELPGLDPKWHDIAVRIEDDVVVTETGYEILTTGLPRTTEEIEAFMAS